MRGRLSLLVLAVLASACGGAIDSQYVLRGYDAHASMAVKRIAVAGWAPSELPQLGALAARIATDRVKLRKNYLVHDTVVLARDWSEACGERQGVLAVRTLELSVDGSDITVLMDAELFRCADGRLLWRTEGELTADADDEDLANLAASYMSQVGPAARRYAAPVFALLQQLLESLPDPMLNDDEVMEKIELGSGKAQAPRVAAR
jgi:probable lipoprotein (TIGR04455 family)